MLMSLISVCTCSFTLHTSCLLQSITVACDDKQNELAGILALANEMHEYGVSEEAGQRIDDKVDLLKQCLVHLCVN